MTIVRSRTLNGGVVTAASILAPQTRQCIKIVSSSSHPSPRIPDPDDTLSRRAHARQLPTLSQQAFQWPLRSGRTLAQSWEVNFLQPLNYSLVNSNNELTLRPCSNMLGTCLMREFCQHVSGIRGQQGEGAQCMPALRCSRPTDGPRRPLGSTFSGHRYPGPAAS
jgi:hypothetical protein